MKLFLVIIVLLVSSMASANGLVINAAEVGIGKFHRLDNQVHPYEATNSWAPYIMPQNITSLSQSPVVYDSTLGTTVLFSNLEELLTTVVKISNEKGQKVSVLNINAHGLPGGMWFPKNAQQLNSFVCGDWVEAAQAPDQANYDQYYSAIPKEELLLLHQIGQIGGNFPCVVSGKDWKEIAAKVPNLKAAFTDDAQIHLLSCLVGLGPVGEAYTAAIGQAVLGGSKSQVHSALKLGLGDWSMPEGMGFWDYVNDEQLAHDNAIYVLNKRDRDIMQPGTIRVSYVKTGTQWASSLVPEQLFMLTSHTEHKLTEPVVEIPSALDKKLIIPPTSVMLPGTNVRLPRY